MTEADNQQGVRVALVGVGYWGVNLLRNLSECPEATLVGVCDADESVRQRIADRYPQLAFWSSLEEMLRVDEIEAVVIATPSGMHADHGLAALSAGKDVLIEKPLADTVDGALKLQREAQRRKRILMVGHTFLYNNIVHSVREQIEMGSLGDVQYAYSQRLNLGRFRRDSDVMWTLAPHDVSILNFLFGDIPTEVSARGMAFVGGQSAPAEVCFALLSYPGSRVAHLHLSWLDPKKRREMVIVGSQKMLVYDDMDAERHLQIYDKRAEAQFIAPVGDFAEFTANIRAGDLVIPSLRLREPLAAEVAHFIEAVRTRKPPRTDGAHGVKVTAILAAMQQSMEHNGRPVTVEYPVIDV